MHLLLQMNVMFDFICKVQQLQHNKMKKNVHSGFKTFSTLRFELKGSKTLSIQSTALFTQPDLNSCGLRYFKCTKYVILY